MCGLQVVPGLFPWQHREVTQKQWLCPWSRGPTPGPGRRALGTECPPCTPLPPQGLLAACLASQAPWRPCRRPPPAHPGPRGVLDTGLPRPEIGSHLPAPGPQRLELGSPPAVCPLTTGQPGASSGLLEGPHPSGMGWGAPPQAPAPQAGSRRGAKGGGMSPRVNPGEALVGRGQTPTGAQVQLWKAFSPALADASRDHPPGLRVLEPAALLWACVAIWW